MKWKVLTKSSFLALYEQFSKCWFAPYNNFTMRTLYYILLYYLHFLILPTTAQLHHMENDIHGSSDYQQQQGSSWAMEVGGHLKIHSVLVENLSKNGQMLVEVCRSWKLQPLHILFLEFTYIEYLSLTLIIMNHATDAMWGVQPFSWDSRSHKKLGTEYFEWCKWSSWWEDMHVFCGWGRIRR